jgi:hypothetical protein
VALDSGEAFDGWLEVRFLLAPSDPPTQFAVGLLAARDSTDAGSGC